MKFLILVFSLFFSSFVFGASNTSQQPVSIQRVNGSSLTCPVGKWCRVVVNIGLDINPTVNSTNVHAASTSTSYFSSIEKSKCESSFEVVLKSGQVISGVVTNAPNISITASTFIASTSSNIAITANAVNVKTCYATFNIHLGTPQAQVITMSTLSNYTFQSFEYFN